MSDKDFLDSINDKPHDVVTTIIMSIPSSWSQDRKDLITNSTPQIIEKLQDELNKEIAPGVILWNTSEGGEGTVEGAGT